MTPLMKKAIAQARPTTNHGLLGILRANSNDTSEGAVTQEEPDAARERRAVAGHHALVAGADTD